MRRATAKRWKSTERPLISIHALLAESDAKSYYFACPFSEFLSTLSLRRATHYDNYNLHCVEISIHALLAESDRRASRQQPAGDISIHALLAESDAIKNRDLYDLIFLSTLSLRRATMIFLVHLLGMYYFYPRSPCGERRPVGFQHSHITGFLSTLSLRRATFYPVSLFGLPGYFYPRSPCGERQAVGKLVAKHIRISIHALLAESDSSWDGASLSTKHFYPRSPCGERPYLHVTPSQIVEFLSTLSLRRATAAMDEYHAAKKFLSTLSLRRATR